MEKQTPFFGHMFAISGKPGSGTSTLFDKCRSQFTGPYRFVSAGEIMRYEAKNRKIDIGDFAAYNLEHPEDGVDWRIDQMINLFGTQDFLVAKGNWVNVFLPGAFTVYLDCDFDIRATRLANDSGKDIVLVRDALQKTDAKDEERFRSLYKPGPLWVPKHHCNIDTAVHDEDEVFELVMLRYQEWRKGMMTSSSPSCILAKSICWPGFTLDVQNMKLE